MRSRNNKRNNGGKRIIILSVIGVFTILAFVIGFKLITGNDQTNHKESQVTDTVDLDSDITEDDYIARGQDDIDSSRAASVQEAKDLDEFDNIADQVNDLSDQAQAVDITDEIDDKSDNSGKNTGDELTADITTPPVVAAPVADKNDPQTEQSDGVKLDISNISSDDNNAEVITYGIDVAKWQGVIDWKQVKSSGVDFAMIRVGYRTLVDGTIYEDPYAEYNLQQAAANKIKIGVYFFSTAINKKEAIEEAKWVTEFIAAYPITYPVVYNCEGFTNPDNRQYGREFDS
jgi:hypothetical protein